jgi:hypothetical protein
MLEILGRTCWWDLQAVCISWRLEAGIEIDIIEGHVAVAFAEICCSNPSLRANFQMS